LKYLYNPPLILKKTFGSFRWNTSNGKILLTFDDGPTPDATEIILDMLDKNKIKAAFFCVGNNVNNYPELARNILNEGHLICNHTFNHNQLTKISYSESLNEINSFTILLKDKFNYNAKYFRPPHGKFKFNTSSLVKKCGLTTIMWSLLTYDFMGDIKAVKLATEKYLRRDSIIVLHDSLKSMNVIRDSINIILETAHKKGFRIGVPEECLK
jgi:peptidoglycan/xylan/chitin deacetylase (PgdA/CDA1 family)